LELVRRALFAPLRMTVVKQTISAKPRGVRTGKSASDSSLRPHMRSVRRHSSRPTDAPSSSCPELPLMLGFSKVVRRQIFLFASSKSLASNPDLLAAISLQVWTIDSSRPLPSSRVSSKPLICGSSRQLETQLDLRPFLKFRRTISHAQAFAERSRISLSATAARTGSGEDRRDCG